MSGLLDQLVVYHPHPWSDRDWTRVSGLPLQDVWFQAADGTKLFGWYVEAAGHSAVLLWCHGNAGNIINRLDNLARLHQLGFSVFLFDYRGYGRSSGSPSEQGLYEDALAAYGHLTDTLHIQPQRIVLFGRSLGAAIAGMVGKQANVGGAFKRDHRIGPGASVGLLADLTDRWKILLSTSYLHFPLGEISDDFRISFGQRYTLQQNLALRFEFNHRRDDDNDAVLAVQAFF